MKLFLAECLLPLWMIGGNLDSARGTLPVIVGKR